MLTESIVLIGMPGSGKSTIGKYIADKLKASFIDTDNLIVDAAGKELQTIIENDGIDAFMSMEKDVIKAFTPSEPCVIATGGSAVLHEEAMNHLKALGKVIFLDADLPLIEKRLWNANSRGIAFGDGANSILDVYIKREPLYYKYSDVRIHVRGKKVSNITKEIIDYINRSNI